MTTTAGTRKRLTPSQERRNHIIRSWLAFMGVSISELGRRVSGQPNAVKDILSGKIASPTPRTLQSIARHLGVSVESLIDPELPAPQFGFGPHACGDALIRIPETVLARNNLQELDFVPFPGKGIEVRLSEVDHLSMAGVNALRVWKIWPEMMTDAERGVPEYVLVDISSRTPERADAAYVAVEFKTAAVIRMGHDFQGHERTIGRVVGRARRPD